MMRLLMVTFVCLTSSCAPVLTGAGGGICLGTSQASDNLGAALVDHMPETPLDVRVASAELLVKLDTGCER